MERKRNHKKNKTQTVLKINSKKSKDHENIMTSMYSTAYLISRLHMVETGDTNPHPYPFYIGFLLSDELWDLLDCASSVLTREENVNIEKLKDLATDCVGGILTYIPILGQGSKEKIGSEISGNCVTFIRKEGSITFLDTRPAPNNRLPEEVLSSIIKPLTNYYTKELESAESIIEFIEKHDKMRSDSKPLDLYSHSL